MTNQQLAEYKITPEVDQVQEFIEIANDFANPLELVREAISNAFDAQATTMSIAFNVVKEYGEDVLVVTMHDNGIGMDRTALKAFFDLGNSTRRGNPETIGEKGHGTKVFFNSAEVQVCTVSKKQRLVATMQQPYKTLCDRQLPHATVQQEDASGSPDGTEIVIRGYNNNRRDKFTHEQLKDYIYWFTKLGSIEEVFGISKHRSFSLDLKGLGIKDFEPLKFGHPFPRESDDIYKLFDRHLTDAPKHFCKRIIKRGQLKNHPEVSYDAVFSLEGNTVKLHSNSMLRRQGVQPPTGAYTVTDRYGLYLCKDFIPVQRANEWISAKGHEYTRFHAFFNCQAFRLTANRGSINNTPSEYLRDIEDAVREIYESITDSDEWRQMTWLEDEAEGHRNTQRESKDFEYRLKLFQRSNCARFNKHELVEPNHESGVFALLLKIATIDPVAFPFCIVDYNTHTGIDIIAKGDHTTPIQQSKLYYVELKFQLTNQLNHSFDNLQALVCWDTKVKHGDKVLDINGNERVLRIEQPSREASYTGYFLDSRRKVQIEVFVLKDYLREKLGIEFRPRTPADRLHLDD
jgi:hypothetical protein